MSEVDYPVTQPSRGPRAAACERCRTRKQKCTHDRPQCMSCKVANTQCRYQWDQDDKDNQIRALQRELQELRSRTTSSPSENSAGRTPSPQRVSESPTQVHSGVANPRQRGNGHAGPLTENVPAQFSPVQSSRSHVQTSSVRQARKSPSPYSLSFQPFNLRLDSAPRSPPSTNQLLERLPLAQFLPLPYLTTLSASDTGLVSQSDVWCDDPEAERACLPCPEDLEDLVDRFFLYFNAAFHIFYEPALRSLVNNFTTGERISRADAFVMFMMLAIACSSRARGYHPRSQIRNAEHAYWQRACLHSTYAMSEKGGMQQLQALHLLLHYVLQNPDAGNVWLISGITIRTAIDMGLHLEKVSAYAQTDPVTMDLRRRLFWATYCIDASLCVTLGRPPGFPSDWINVDLPSLCPDEDITPSGITHGRVNPSKQAMHHLIRLRCIQAEIHRTLYSETACHRTPDLTWMDDTQRRLDQWRQERPQLAVDDGFINKEWLDLKYHLTCSFLNRPCPGNQKPDEKRLQRALKSSTGTMQTMKIMYRAGRINYVWMAINHLFMSEITFLSCCLLITDRTQLPNLVEAMMNIQACSSVLEALSTIQPGATAIRDALEKVSAAVIHTFSGIPAPAPAVTSLTGDDSMMQLDGLFTGPPAENLAIGSNEEAWQALTALLSDPTVQSNLGQVGVFGNHNMYQGNGVLSQDQDQGPLLYSNWPLN